MSLLGKGRRGRRLGLVVAGSLFAFQALALIGAAPASAAFATCDFSGGTLTIQLGAGNFVYVSANGTDDVTIDGADTVAAGCTGVATRAGLANTTAISVQGNTGDEEAAIDLSVDWGTINWTISLLTGTADDVWLDGGGVAAADAIDVVIGATGIDLTNDGDLDATVSGAETVFVTGSPGDDSISGAGSTAAGAATTIDLDVSAGLGDDSIASGAGNDAIDGGGGEDVADFSGATAAVTATVNGLASGMGVDTLTTVEDLVGSAQSDTLTGDVNDNVITGGALDDKINCVGDGTDEDTVDFSDATADVVVDLDAGTATGDGSDTISNCEDVQGGDGNDTISGDANDNALFGGSGNDTLAGGDGDGDGADTLDGEGGIDWVDYTLAVDDVTVDMPKATVGATAGACNDALEMVFGQAGEGDCVTGTENAALGTGDDTFVGDGFGNTVQPGGGQNILTGGGGGDTLDYSVGYDAGVEINLAGGSSSVDAIDSFENVKGTAFADSITGSDGSNLIKAAKGNDNVRAGAGDDTIKAGAGNDKVRAGSGDDDLFGGKGNDYLNGGSGDDFCKGGPGKDTVKKCETGKK